MLEMEKMAAEDGPNVSGSFIIHRGPAFESDTISHLNIMHPTA
jgi:hypothetical protein